MCDRGLISSLLVAGFTGCGVVFYLLDLIFQAVGPTRCACPRCRAEPLTPVSQRSLSISTLKGTHLLAWLTLCQAACCTSWPIYRMHLSLLQSCRHAAVT